MTNLLDHHRALRAAWTDFGPLQVPGHYGDTAAEYHRLTTGVALHDRAYRGLIEVRGRDRAAWLHNLLTNDIKGLAAGRGCYAFALNVKGRILFDVNVLATGDALLLDIDHRWIAPALAHFEKYIIMEDVHLADVSGANARIAICGPALTRLAAAFPVAHPPEQGSLRQPPAPVAGIPASPDAAAPPAASAASPALPGSAAEGHETPLLTWPSFDLSAMSALQHADTSIAGHAVRIFRHDFAGVLGMELIVPAAHALDIWKACVETLAAVGDLDPNAPAEPQLVAGLAAVQIARIEAGIPWPLADIDEQVLPAETGQLDRAVSFKKGCYLGQEVVERMRAHRSLARRLVGLRFTGDSAPALTAATAEAGSVASTSVPHGAALHKDGTAVGRITSMAFSPRLGQPIGLGYVKAPLAVENTELSTQFNQASVACHVAPLPI